LTPLGARAIAAYLAELSAVAPRLPLYFCHAPPPAQHASVAGAGQPCGLGPSELCELLWECARQPSLASTFTGVLFADLNVRALAGRAGLACPRGSALRAGCCRLELVWGHACQPPCVSCPACPASSCPSSCRREHGLRGCRNALPRRSWPCAAGGRSSQGAHING
jgi:hypothetical protein